MQQQEIKPTVDHWLFTAGLKIVDSQRTDPPEPKKVKAKPKKRNTAATRRLDRIRKALLPLLKDGLTNTQAYDTLIPTGTLKKDCGKNLCKERVANICSNLRTEYALDKSESENGVSE